MREVYVAIDLGTSKACAVIGTCDSRGWVEVLGKGSCSHNAIKKGIIIDIDDVATAMRKALQEAEREANLNVRSAYININCMHANLETYSASLAVNNSTGTVTSKEIEELHNKIYNIPINSGRQVVDIIPREYQIDKYTGIVDPRGMVAKELRVEAEVVIADTMHLRSLTGALDKIGLKCDGIIFEPLANSEVVLNDEEREKGSLLIDVGSCITDIVFYKDYKLQFSSSILVGGWQISNDLAVCLNISFEEAEKIKRKYELALTDLIQNDQDIYVKDKSSNNRKSVKVSCAVEIIEARVFEIFEICRQVIESTNRDNEIRRIVIAGAGIHYMDGAPQMASAIFKVPTRRATWKLVGHENAEFGLAISMIHHIKKTRSKKADVSSEILTEDDLFSIPKEGYEEFERRVLVAIKKFKKWFRWVMKKLF